MSRNLPVRIAVAAAMLVALAALPAPAIAREFRVADTQAEDYPTVQALKFMARLVEQRTNGRHRIHIFHSRQLGEEKETIEQTRAGAIDLNRTNVAPIGSLVPAANVLALPFLFRSFNHLHKVLDREIGDEILGGFQRNGFIGLTFYDFRRPLDLQQRAAGPHARRHEGPAHPHSAVRADVQHAAGARRRTGRAAVRPGADRPADQADRRGGKQLAVLRHHRTLQDRAVLYADRAHDGPRGSGHVDTRMG